MVRVISFLSGSRVLLSAMFFLVSMAFVLASLRVDSRSSGDFLLSFSLIRLMDASIRCWYFSMILSRIRFCVFLRRFSGSRVSLLSWFISVSAGVASTLTATVVCVVSVLVTSGVSLGIVASFVITISAEPNV